MSIIFILKVLEAVILTEAITELGVKSEIFGPVRKFLFESDNKVLNFIHRVFDCGYCFSVWAGLLSTICIFGINTFILNFFILALVIHRLSNGFHFLLDRLWKD